MPAMHSEFPARSSSVEFGKKGRSIAQPMFVFQTEQRMTQMPCAARDF